MFEKFFKLKQNGTNVRTEIIAGITTFLTMAYILAVNPNILSATGMDAHALFTTTAIAAIFGTLVMALWAKLPFALAPRITSYHVCYTKLLRFLSFFSVL